jgi:hypothetical protein
MATMTNYMIMDQIRRRATHKDGIDFLNKYSSTIEQLSQKERRSAATAVEWVITGMSTRSDDESAVPEKTRDHYTMIVARAQKYLDEYNKIFITMTVDPVMDPVATRTVDS